MQERINSYVARNIIYFKAVLYYLTNIVSSLDDELCIIYADTHKTW